MGTINIDLTFEGIDLRVQAYHQPFEPVEYEDGLAVYPGCAEGLDIEAVTVKGVDIFELIDESVQAKISEAIFEKWGEDAQDAANERASEAQAEREDYYR